MVARRALARAVLDEFGQTFAEEAGIRLARGNPAALYQLSYLSMLLGAPIRSESAVEAARALRKAGLTTARKMARASWQERVDVITWHGYKRFDERGATRLGKCAEFLLERYRGDLRELRAAAGGDRRRLEALLTECPGIGAVAAAIFLREVQLVWDEVYPYADERVLRAAQRLGLGKDAPSLARLVTQKEFPRLVAGLVRVELRKAYAGIQAFAERHAA